MSNTNTGNYNTGYCNTGSYNTGNHNTGSRNTGSYNTGSYNTGNCNTGYCNTGYWNSVDMCTGAFNNKPQKMILFNKTLDMTVEEFYKQYNLHADIQLNEWVLLSQMSGEEKKEFPDYITTGGYLKTLPYKDACRKWWSKASEKEKNKFLSLPWFDWEVFTDITGIEQEYEEEMTMEEVCRALGKNIKIKK